MQRSRLGSYGFGMLIFSGALAFGTTPRAVAAASSAGPPPVEFFGCTALKGTAQQFACMLVPDDQLTLWVRGRDCKDIQVTDSGQPLQPETKFIQGGCQLRLPRSSGLHQSTLTLTDRRTQQPLWSMPLDRSKPTLLEWKRKVWDRASSNLEDILPDLQRKATERLDPEELIDVTYALGWVNFRIGNRSEALRYYDYTVQLSKKHSYLSIAIEAINKKIDVLWPIGMHVEAHNALIDLSQFSIPGDARSTIVSQWEYGILARAEEHLEIAANQLASVVEQSERVNDRPVRVLATPLLAELYAKLDRRDLAETLLAGTDDLLIGMTPCRQSRLLTGSAWVGLELTQGQKDGEDKSILVGQKSVREMFLQALQLRQKCTETSALANLYLGLLTLSIEERRLDEARDWLLKAKATPDPSNVTLIELLEQEGRLALIGGRPQSALNLFRNMDSLIRKNGPQFSKMHACRANIGVVESLSALGQQDQNAVDSVRVCIRELGAHTPATMVRHIVRRLNSAGVSIVD